VPIIAQKGEEVLTRGDPRHRFNLRSREDAPVTVSVPVSVNIQTPQGTQARTAQRRDSGGGLTLDIIVEQITDAISGDIVRGQGIAPVLERQYGLNRANGAYR